MTTWSPSRCIDLVVTSWSGWLYQVYTTYNRSNGVVVVYEHSQHQLLGPACTLNTRLVAFLGRPVSWNWPVTSAKIHSCNTEQTPSATVQEVQHWVQHPTTQLFELTIHDMHSVREAKAVTANKGLAQPCSR